MYLDGKLQNILNTFQDIVASTSTTTLFAERTLQNPWDWTAVGL